MGIDTATMVEHYVAMTVKPFLVVINSRCYHREIQVDNKIAVVLRRWVLTNIQSSKQLLKLILFADVVVMFKHGDGKALAESARPYKEEVHIRVFYFLDERSLIYIVAIPFNHILKILHTIRYSLAIDSLFSFSYHSSLLFAMTEYKVTKYS